MADEAACALVVLAAGGSSRMGRPKQLLQMEREPLVRLAALTALQAGLHPTLVVLGAHAEEIRPHLERLPLQLIDNPHWREGIASSLRAAVEAVEGASDVRGLIVMLADQPRMAAAHLASIESAQRATGRSIVASSYGDHLGPPAYFGRRHFSALHALRGDVGARALLQAADTYAVAVPPGMSADLDTAADYAALRGES